MLKSMRLRPITRDCRRADTRSAARKSQRETQGLQSGSSGMPLWGQTTARGPTMKAKDDDMESIQGSGNIFADFGDPDAETKLLKAQTAADIINALNERGLSVRAGAKVA